jgi:hypothetical protein
MTSTPIVSRVVDVAAIAHDARPPSFGALAAAR